MKLEGCKLILDEQKEKVGFSLEEASNLAQDYRKIHGRDNVTVISHNDPWGGLIYGIKIENKHRDVDWRGSSSGSYPE